MASNSIIRSSDPIRTDPKLTLIQMVFNNSNVMIRQVYLSLCVVLMNILCTAQTTLTPGRVFRDCDDCPEMVVVPEGNFTMGATAEELAGDQFSKIRSQLEGPPRVVNINRFAAGKYTITRQQWATFVTDTNRPTAGGCRWSRLAGEEGSKPWDPHPQASWKNLGFEQDDNHPAVCVTWHDAQDYVRWLSSRTGKHYRLLTEAEWEYAARAGTTTPYPWGTKASHEYSNYGTDTVAGVGFASGRDKWMYTSPVGSFPPNQFGLYDMHGNVLQWVEDCFSPTYSGLPGDGSAYTKDARIESMEAPFTHLNGESCCSFRICRGGDAWDNPILIRSASRVWGRVTEEMHGTAGLGFRVARSIP